MKQQRPNCCLQSHERRSIVLSDNVEVAEDCVQVCTSGCVTGVTRGVIKCGTAPMTLREVVRIAQLATLKPRRSLDKGLAAAEVPRLEVIRGVIDGVATGAGGSIW